MSNNKWLTHDRFVGRLGEMFMMTPEGAAPLALELIEATEFTEPGGRGPEGQERRQFTLVFRGPAEPMLPQQIYPLTHDELGPLDLFLVPIGPDQVGMRYQAAFA